MANLKLQAASPLAAQWATPTGLSSGHSVGVVFEPMKDSLLAILIAVLAMLLAGCSRTLTYTRNADGSESFTYTNVGLDVKIGKLTIDKTAAGVTVGVENLDSQSRAMVLAEKAVDVAAKVVVRP